MYDSIIVAVLLVTILLYIHHENQKQINENAAAEYRSKCASVCKEWNNI